MTYTNSIPPLNSSTIRELYNQIVSSDNLCSINGIVKDISKFPLPSNCLEWYNIEIYSLDYHINYQLSVYWVSQEWYQECWKKRLLTVSWKDSQIPKIGESVYSIVYPQKQFFISEIRQYKQISNIRTCTFPIIETYPYYSMLVGFISITILLLIFWKRYIKRNQNKK